MNRKEIFIIFMLIILISLNSMVVMADEHEEVREDKQNILIFMLAYPEYIKSVEKTEDGLIYFIMWNDERVLYDDKKIKNEEECFFNTDLEDMLKIVYPLEKINEVHNSDPGRLRNYKLLSCVYGNNKEEVEKNLTTMPTKYGYVMFNKANNAAENLKKSLNEIYDLALSNNKINQYICPINGTFNYRRIQDTGMLSPHAYGIAIDLNRNDLDYWKWTDKEHASKRIASYPSEVIEVFENNGFVWGGKWKHFDILHFEYKPEIIMKAKCLQNDNLNDEWYKAMEEYDADIELINLINNIFD